MVFTLPALAAIAPIPSASRRRILPQGAYTTVGRRLVDDAWRAPGLAKGFAFSSPRKHHVRFADEDCAHEVDMVVPQSRPPSAGTPVRVWIGHGDLPDV